METNFSMLTQSFAETLADFKFGGCFLSTDSLRKLCQFKNLIELSIINAQNLDDVGLISIMEETKVTVLKLLCSDRVTEEGISRLFNHSTFERLRELSLMGFTNLTDACLISDRERASNLRHLNLGDHDSLTDQGIDEVIMRCWSTKVLCCPSVHGSVCG